MKTKLFVVSYSWGNNKAHTVVRSTRKRDAGKAFYKANPHVKITAID